ncbi:cupredoxin domain-containing protein, partial [Klebsiella pneumoniae]|nr:cupredoxin domain-containing protein [Klebsiella pneumoniae]
MALCLSVLSLISLPAAAAEKFTVELEMNNGELTPPVLKVPAKTPIRIKISNTGTE